MRTPPARERVDLLSRVRDRLVDGGIEPSGPAVASAVRAEAGVLGESAVLDLADAIAADLHGLGPLEPLLADPAVTDILVNGSGALWLDRGSGLEAVSGVFDSDEQVRELAQRLAARCGRRLDDAQPWVDARLDDGTRIHAVLPPVAAPGPLVSIRVVRPVAFTLQDLVDRGALPADGATWLRAMVHSRLAFVLTGGTGTGKTTVLSALLSEVDPRHRIVVVEDSAELAPRHPHVVRLESRVANVEGRGQISVRDLVRQALRMRPDRVVVGEARGVEVVDLLGAMNTGHEGGCATVHANSAADLPARLEALGALAGLGREAVHAQAVSALDVVVHLVRDRDGLRRIDELHVLRRGRDGLVVTEPALRFPRGEATRGEAGESALRRRIERA